MKFLASRIALIAAAAGMVVAPIAAQAKTRAGDSGTTYSQSALSQPGLGRTVDGASNLANQEDDDDIVGIILALLGGAAVIAALIMIDDADDQSPGT